MLLTKCGMTPPSLSFQNCERSEQYPESIFVSGHSPIDIELGKIPRHPVIKQDKSAA